MFPGDLVTAAAAARRRESAARQPKSGSAPAHFRNARRSGIDRLQTLDHVSSAALIACSRTVARAVEIHADPTLVFDLRENAMAGRKIDLAVAQVINTLEEFRVRRVLHV